MAKYSFWDYLYLSLKLQGRSLSKDVLMSLGHHVRKRGVHPLLSIWVEVAKVPALSGVGVGCFTGRWGRSHSETDGTVRAGQRGKEGGAVLGRRE